MPRRETRLGHPGALVAAAVAAAGLVLLTGGTPPPTGPSARRRALGVGGRAPPPQPLESQPLVSPPPATSVPTASSPTGTSPAANPAPPATSGSDEGWREAATGFATAFTTTTGPGQDWAAGLIPWVSPVLAAAYQRTAPTRLPTGTLLQVTADSERPDLVVATAAYDTGLQLAIELAPAPDTSTGWVVRTVLAVPSPPE